MLCAVRCVITLSGPCSYYLGHGPSFSLKCSLELMWPSRPAFECGGHPLGLPMGRGHEGPLAELGQKGPGPPARALCPEFMPLLSSLHKGGPKLPATLVSFRVTHL